MTSDRTRRGPGRGAPGLFEIGELQLHATAEARFRALARVATRAPTGRETRADEDRATLAQLRARAKVLAPRFDLRFARIEAERDGVHGHYGICYADGLIRIRLRHALTGRLLKESSLVDTLCHELAHLRHMDHSERFRALHRTILDEARGLGYYRPGSGRPETDRPRQGMLFDECGVASRSRGGDP